VLSLMGDRSQKEQLRLLTPEDVYIKPDLEGFSSGDFYRAARIMPRGIEAAEGAETSLSRYSLPDSDYSAYRAGIEKRIPEAAGIVSFIDINNESNLSTRVLRGRMKTEAGQPLDVKTLQDDVLRIYETNVFSGVDFNIVDKNGEQGILINAYRRQGHPDALRLGGSIFDDFRGFSLYTMNIGYTRYEINSLGAEWRSELQFGTTRKAGTELLLPLDYSGSFFVAPGVEWSSGLTDIFSNDHQIADYRTAISKVTLRAGYQFSEYGCVEAGIMKGTVDAKTVIGESGVLPKYDEGYAGVEGKYILDQIDNIGFPQHGTRIDLRYFHSLESLGAASSYDKAEVRFLQPFSFGKNTLLAMVNAGSSLDSDIPFYDEFTLGGLFRLSGYEQDYFRGSHYGLGDIIYMRRVRSFPDVYLGVSAECGKMWKGRFESDFDDLRVCGSIFGGMDTPLGPIYVGFGLGEAHSAFYFLLGNPFF